ncbi:MAG TPA: ComEA family DNA-binding protein [Gemmatimonadales bacterium]
MATRDDRRAALVLMGLALVGVLVRAVRGGSTPPGAVAYRASPAPRPLRDSVASRSSRLARPLGTGERIDVDRAPAEELVRLPGVGRGLAGRIVADREAQGPFGSLEGLGRVRGIGPAALERLGPHTTFRSRAARSPPAGPAPVPINRASAEQLVALPGIGPALAAAIVEERRSGGPFRSLDDLARVPGLGATRIARLKTRIVIP